MRPHLQGRSERIPPRLIMLAAFASSSLVNYAFGLVMGWLLVPGDYGLLAFALTVGLIAGVVLQLGIPSSLTVAIVGIGEPVRAALVRGALVANLAFSGCIALVMMGLFALGPLRPGMESWTVTTIVALSLPFVAIMSIVAGVAQADERFPAIGIVQVAEIAAKAVAGVVLVKLGFGPTGALLGLPVGALAGMSVSAYILVRVLQVPLHGPIRFPPFGATGSMFCAQLGLVLLLNLDLIALKLLSGNHRGLTGDYQAGIVLANAPYYLVTSALVPILFTQLARRKDICRSAEAVGELLAVTAVLVIPIEVVLALAPAQALKLFFPGSYAPGAPSLRLLAIGNGVLLVVSVLAAAFQALGQARVPAVILLGITTVEPFVLWFVVPRWLTVGAAFVFVSMSSVALVALGGIYLHRIGLPWTRRTARWLLRYAAAGVVGLLFGVMATHVAGSLYVSIAVGGLCYLACAHALELTPGMSLFAIQGMSSRRPTLLSEE